MKVEKISIDDIIEHVRKMVVENQKITVRGVMARSGGSPAKITEAIKAYYEEQKQQVDDVSDELMNAMLKEKVVAAEKVRIEVRDRMLQQDGIINELREIISQNEIKLQQAAETEARLIGVEAKLKVLESELSISKEQKDRALTEIATVKQQLQHAHDKAHGFEVERQDLNNKLQLVVQDKQQIEQDRINLRARLEQAQEQLSVLYSKLGIK
jgi:chromosome segregation ATPase